MKIFSGKRMFTTKKKLIELCEEIMDSQKIKAACVKSSENSRFFGDVEILIVAKNFIPRLLTQVKPYNSGKVFFLIVDQGVFEKDVNEGWLGEYVAETVTLPYEPLINGVYLNRQEVKAKKRVVYELSENIVTEFPEISGELLIKPEFYIAEMIMRKVRIYPPILYRFQKLFGDFRSAQISMMDGYRKAFRKLEEDKIFFLSGKYIKLDKQFISSVKKHKFKIPRLFRMIRETFFLYVLGVIPNMVNPLIRDQEVILKTAKNVENRGQIFNIEEPEENLLIPTSTGLVSLSDKTTIEDFARNFFAGEAQVHVERMGGVLNSVYMLTLESNGATQKIVVKKFKNWLSFKWFPLALWTVGTKNFRVLGRSRLEREYAMNRLLHNKGFTVPRIIHASIRKGVIFEEFVEGESLAEVVKDVTKSKGDVEAKLKLVKEAGKTIAEAHLAKVVLGDCKPENFLVTSDESICFLDLEQAAQDGNQAWDIAEFIYYSGHYTPPLTSVKPVKAMTASFLEGYLEGGGKRSDVEKAASPRYTKVFSIFTLPHVLLAVSNVCKDVSRKSFVNHY